MQGEGYLGPLLNLYLHPSGSPLYGFPIETETVPPILAELIL